VPQSADAPFGHAGERLHEWMFRTRFWHEGGSAGVDDAFAQRHGYGIGTEIMGANKFGPQVPIVLGRGVRIWDGVEGLEDSYDVEVISSPGGVTHLTFTRKTA
jgi:hypothetical protein